MNDDDLPQKNARNSKKWGLFAIFTTYLLHHSELKNKEIEQIVNSTIPNKRKRNFMSTAQRLRKEGLQEGIGRGRQEGRQEGEWIGKVELLEQMLETPATPKHLLLAEPLAKLQARFNILEKEYRKRFR
jgi:predicted transposase YdaD